MTKYYRTPRKVYNYELVGPNGRIRYRGITNNPKRREAQHRASGKRFKYLRYDPNPCSRETARKRERKAIEIFKKGHKGKKPIYNKS